MCGSGEGPPPNVDLRRMLTGPATRIAQRPVSLLSIHAGIRPTDDSRGRYSRLCAGLWNCVVLPDEDHSGETTLSLADD
jgi:hypothetical protein